MQVAERGAPVSSDWRTAIPETNRRPIRAWLWSIAAMTAAVLVVGGITRLTLSGLSIVDWDPLFGIIPPLTDAQWQERFAQYQQFPDYSWRDGMTLSEFRFIYFWEYLHRLLARMIGVVFLIPFVVFAVRRRFTRPLAVRALGLFALGGMQGLMGWLMVMSGLVDRPSVSHYRLAAHLCLAFIIFGAAVWLARELSVTPLRTTVPSRTRRLVTRGLTSFGVVLGVQVVWGAFVAGLRAGKFYPTFPLMGGGLVPPDLLTLDPVTRNFLENPVAVQWLHRVIGTVLLVIAAAFTVRVLRSDADVTARRYAVSLLALVCVQYLLGILTLVHLVPVSLGVTHQFTALMLFGVWIASVHHARNLEVRDTAL